MNWYYLNAAEEVIGPLQESELRALRDSGNIQDDTRVCREGDEAWRCFSEAIRTPPALPTTVRNVDSSLGSLTLDPKAPQSTQLVTESVTSTATRNLKPVMIGCGVALLVGGICAFGVLFAIIGAINQTPSDKSDSSVASSQTSTSNRVEDANEAKIQQFQKDFGVPLDYESAIVYSTAHHIGANANPGTTLGQLLEIARQGSSGAPQFQKVMEAGMRDGFEGRPNRIEGVKFDKSDDASQ